jgi:hypothetical protein
MSSTYGFEIEDKPTKEATSLSNKLVLTIFVINAIGTWGLTIYNTVNYNKTPDNTCLCNKIQLNNIGIDGQAITIGSVTGDKLTDSTITNSKFMPNVITTDKISIGGVTNQNLGINSVTSTNIMDGSITNNKLIDGTISGSKLLSGSIDSSKIMNGVINSNVLLNKTITNNLLSDASVYGTVIKSHSIMSSHMDPQAVAGLYRSDNVNGWLTLHRTDYTVTQSIVNGGVNDLYRSGIDFVNLFIGELTIFFYISTNSNGFKVDSYKYFCFYEGGNFSVSKLITFNDSNGFNISIQFVNVSGEYRIRVVNSDTKTFSYYIVSNLIVS